MMMLIFLLACQKTPSDTVQGETTAPPDSSSPQDSLPAGEACPEASPGGDPLLQWSGERPSNLLMISIDTLRRDYIGRYRGGSSASPFIDQLLEEGVALDDHQSCNSWTFPSVLCAVSGQGNMEMGYMPVIYDTPPDPLPKDIDLLSDWILAEGYATGLVSANTYFSTQYRTAGGYEEVESNNGVSAEGIAASGLATLKTLRGQDKPWFLHLHFLDPHFPYDPPDAFVELPKDLDLIPWDLRTSTGLNRLASAWPDLSEEEQALAFRWIDVLYSGEIRYLDFTLQAFMEELDAQGALDDTLVVFWSDHGEQFYEHQEWEHGKSIHAEETNAIAGFWAKSGLESASTSNLTQHEDLVPTILDALGLPIPEQVTGEIVGTASPDRDQMAMRVFGPDGDFSILYQNYKFVHRWAGSFALFDRSVDPQEQEDIFSREHPLYDCFREKLAVHLARLEAYGGDFNVTVPD